MCDVPNIGWPRWRDWGVDMAPTSMEATPQFWGAKRNWAAPVAMRVGTGATGTPIARMTEDASERKPRCNFSSSSQGPRHTPQYEPRPCQQVVKDILGEGDSCSQIGQMDPNKVTLFHTFLHQPPHTFHSQKGQITRHFVAAINEVMPMEERNRGTDGHRGHVETTASGDASTTGGHASATASDASTTASSHTSTTTGHASTIASSHASATAASNPAGETTSCALTTAGSCSHAVTATSSHADTTLSGAACCATARGTASGHASATPSRHSGATTSSNASRKPRKAHRTARAHASTAASSSVENCHPAGRRSASKGRQTGRPERSGLYPCR